MAQLEPPPALPPAPAKQRTRIILETDVKESIFVFQGNSQSAASPSEEQNAENSGEKNEWWRTWPCNISWVCNPSIQFEWVRYGEAKSTIENLDDQGNIVLQGTDTTKVTTNEVRLRRDKYCRCSHPCCWASFGFLLSAFALTFELSYAVSDLPFEAIDRVTQMSAYSEVAYASPMNLDTLRNKLEEGEKGGWKKKRPSSKTSLDYIGNVLDASKGNPGYPLKNGALFKSIFHKSESTGTCNLDPMKQCELAQLFVASVHVFYTAVDRILEIDPKSNDISHRMILSFLDRMLGVALDQLLRNVVGPDWSTTFASSATLPTLPQSAAAQYQALALIVSANQLVQQFGRTACLFLCSEFSASKSCDMVYGKQYAISNLTKASTLKQTVNSVTVGSLLSTKRCTKTNSNPGSLSTLSACAKSNYEDGLWNDKFDDVVGFSIAELGNYSNASTYAPWHAWLRASNATEVSITIPHGGSSNAPLAQLLHSHCTLVHSSRIWMSEYWDYGLAYSIPSGTSSLDNWDKVKDELREGRRRQAERVPTTIALSASFTMICGSLLFLCASLVMLIAVATSFLPQRLLWLSNMENTTAVTKTFPDRLVFVIADIRSERWLAGAITFAFLIVILLRIILVAPVGYASLGSQTGGALDDTITVVLSPNQRNEHQFDVVQGLLMPILLLAGPLLWRAFILLFLSDTAEGWWTQEKVNESLLKASSNVFLNQVKLAEGQGFSEGIFYNDRVYDQIRKDTLQQSRDIRRTKVVGIPDLPTALRTLIYALRHPSKCCSVLAVQSLLVLSTWSPIIVLGVVAILDLIGAISDFSDMIDKDVFGGDASMVRTVGRIRTFSELILVTLFAVTLTSVYAFTRSNLESQVELREMQGRQEYVRGNALAIRSIFGWAFYGLLSGGLIIGWIVSLDVSLGGTDKGSDEHEDKNAIYSILGGVLGIITFFRLLLSDYLYVSKTGSTNPGFFTAELVNDNTSSVQNQRSNASAAANGTASMATRSAFPPLSRLALFSHTKQRACVWHSPYAYNSVRTEGWGSDQDF